MFGKEMTVEEVLDEVERDASFYRTSGGGMTLSGGECQLQPDFAAALLEEAHNRGINTAIETAGNVPWSFMEKVLPHVDTMLHDHKLTIPERHKKWTGVDNKRILKNFKKAYETFPDVEFIARTPLIPGVNDDEEHIRAVLEFIRPHKNVIDYELLPYHRFGTSPMNRFSDCRISSTKPLAAAKKTDIVKIMGSGSTSLPVSPNGKNSAWCIWRRSLNEAAPILPL
jgi:pyruvate formate lyase activating enzyme